ncbi:MAG: DNA-binding transcriptional regulator Fis [Gammaproteobacteria bacterium]|nr:DNA-binding transcriptional regulator Fis [Gammaproteobacteria bacterium]
MTVGVTHSQEEQTMPFTVAKNKTKEPLRECVRDALNSYFVHLDGHKAAGLYQLVLAEMEQPLLETVMKYAEGNQTKAAALLGISRSTLRKKLTIYQLD